MKKSSRYLLIVLGVVVFFILAPLLILYVTGTNLRSSGTSDRSTGLLDVKSEPSGAKVFVGNDEKGSAPATIRFLARGEYEVKLTKGGYYDWIKRLPIEAGQVTFAQVGVDQVQLIKQTLPEVITEKGVKSFVLINNTAWYTSDSTLTKVNINNFSERSTLNLSFPPTSLTALRDSRYLEVRNGAAVNIVDTGTNAIYSLPSSSNISNDVFVAGNTIIYRDNYQVKALDMVTSALQTVRSDVTAFSMLGTTAYFIDNNRTAQGGTTITSAVWNGTTFTDLQTILGNVNIKPFFFNKLIITGNKELFVQNDNNFYRVEQNGLDLLTTSLVFSKMDQVTNELVFSTGSELWFYNFRTNKPQLVTRGTTVAHDFMVRSNIGYGFIADSRGLEIVELDTRDRQNRYQVLKEKSVYQIAITENQKTIVALQDGSLVKIELRD
jgi:hypothetical protein